MKFVIKDWANNVCFKGQEFDDFEAAWDFIYEQYPDNDGSDGTFDEYFVEATGSDHYVDESLTRQGIK